MDNIPIEKDNVIHEERTQGGLSQADLDFVANFPPERRRKVLRKIDVRVVPMLLLLYLFAYLDKTNIGNAKIEGLKDDLKLYGIKFNIVVAIFFIPFVVFEIPSNMILHRISRPSWYISAIVFAWGTIMTLTGIVQSYHGLLAARFFQGIFEAGFLPGAILIISNWYLPNETQKRIAILYSSAATGGAISGLLAYGIVRMDGLGGLEGWRWIFILEGLATVVIAILCIFCLCDSPALSTGWLDAEEIRYLELRQATRRVTTPGEYRDNGNEKPAHSWRLVKDILFDYKIYLLIFANWSNAVPNYALKFAMPSVIVTMGYKAENAQLLTIPPYFVGAVSAFTWAYFADRFSWRYPFILLPQLCLVTAYSILCGLAPHIEDHVPECYFALILATFGMYPILPGVNAWNVANTPNPAKRSINIGILICIGNIGGLIGSYIYLDSEKPAYPTGYGTSLGFAIAGITAATLLEFLLHRSNKKNAQLSEEEVRAKYTDEQLDAMGDKSPLFKYAL